jgi:hypothetical protein
MRYLLALLIVTLSASLARAEPSAAQREQLRQARLATLQARLQLDVSDARRVQAVVDRFRARSVPLRRADAVLLRQMREQLQLSTPDPQRIKSLTAGLVKNRAQLQALRDLRLRELEHTLSPAQFARLMVSWPQLSRELHEEARHILNS